MCVLYRFKAEESEFWTDCMACPGDKTTQVPKNSLLSRYFLTDISGLTSLRTPFIQALAEVEV